MHSRDMGPGQCVQNGMAGNGSISTHETQKSEHKAGPGSQSRGTVESRRSLVQRRRTKHLRSGREEAD